MENQLALVSLELNQSEINSKFATLQGDSGGGLTIQDGTRRILVGIVSFGSNAGCQRGYPTAFR
jgi:secreted trypsin-like serine protease